MVWVSAKVRSGVDLILLLWQENLKFAPGSSCSGPRMTPP